MEILILADRRGAREEGRGGSRQEGKERSEPENFPRKKTQKGKVCEKVSYF